MGNEEPLAQLDDAGLSALVIIARFYGIATDAAQLKHAAALRSGAFSEAQLVLSACSIGLKARAVPLTVGRLGKTPFPALVMDRTGRHFILAGSTGDTALVLEPGMQAPARSTCSGRNRAYRQPLQAQCCPTRSVASSARRVTRFC
jgi:subfamily B ATP-binding cassette protein HlyB/CyaB